MGMVPAGGVAADLGHLEKKAEVKSYVMELNVDKAIDKLGECLTGCNLVLVPAGMPRKPGQTRDDLFKVNADIAKGIVPAMAELYKKKGLDPHKILGVTTLDCVRSNKFVGEATNKNPSFINVSVIGGHAGVPILPVFSQDKTAKTID